MPLPTKPRIIIESNRDEYSARIVVRYRRNWETMTPAERRSVLQDGAAALEKFASEMRTEAQQMAM